MLKLIKILLITWSLTATAGLPPSTINGERDTASSTKLNLRVPNYQSTDLGGLNSRVETGNTNLLVNPSFEHSTVATGWTITNATSSADTTNQVEGKKALSLSLTGALSVVQDSTINAANISGLQGLASIKIKTSDVDGLKVCSRNDGTTSISLCINIPKDGVWKEVNIPYILSSTSNGIAITSTGASGTVKIDNAFVGTSAPFQNVNGAKLVGTISWAATASCDWTQTTSTSAFTSFTANASCPTPTVTGSITAPGTKIPGFGLVTQAGTYFIVANSRFSSNYGATGTLQILLNDGTTSFDGGSTYSDIGGVSTLGHTNSASFTATYTSSQSLNFQLGARTSTSGLNQNIVASTSGQGLTISVYYFPPESKIYSQNGDLRSLTTVYSAGITNAGVVYTQNTDPAWISSASWSPTGQLNVNFNTGVFTVTPMCWAIPSATGQRMTINTNSASSVTFQNRSNDGTANVNTDANVFCAKVGNDYSNSFKPVIVGSFAGLEKCANDYECTDTFSAYLLSSSNTISNQNIPWLSSCTGTGTKTCTFNTNLKDGTNPLSGKMNCQVIPEAGNGTPEAQIEPSTSSTQLVFTSYASAGGVTQSFGWYINCQKGTNDYKPKTAKVASSIGVPTVPGILTTGTGNTIDTFSVSYGTTNATTVCSASPCSYLDQIGNAVSSVTRSGVGSYSLNLSKTYVKLKCVMNQNVNITSYGWNTPIQCSSCSSVSFSTYNSGGSAGQDTVGTLYCQGSY